MNEGRKKHRIENKTLVWGMSAYVLNGLAIVCVTEYNSSLTLSIHTLDLARYSILLHYTNTLTPHGPDLAYW